MGPGQLLVERREEAAWITLSRPETRNALTPALVDAAIAALDAIERDPSVRCVVLTGAGPAFCSGYDLALLESPGRPDAGVERDLVERLCGRLRAVSIPTVAAVNGVASGAGLELAVSCDLRFAADTARLSLPPARLGILSSRQGIARLVALVGPARAKELLFGGELVDSGRALSMGLVDRVVPSDRLLEETAAFARLVARNAPLAVAAAKLVVDLVSDGSSLGDAAAARIDEAERRVWASEDAREGPAAFRERRAPRFRGR